MIKIINKLEENESEKVLFVKPSVGSNNYYIKSKQSNELPNIVFRFNKDSFIVSNIYLKNCNKGTGTFVIGEFISIARELKCPKFEIRIVKSINKRMIHICEKFRMEKRENDNEYFDFFLKL